MVKIAIRDDDTNFFTKVEDIVDVYKSIQDFPISYAVIPTVLDVSTHNACKETRGNKTPRWVGDNSELTEWLKMQLKEHKLDVLMHGITHGYKMCDDKRYPEMVWRQENNLTEVISSYKNKLSSLFDYPISVFVSPSNMISKYGIRCVANSSLNFSGIVPVGFERDLTLKNISSWLKRVAVRVYSGIPYPGVLEYSDHLELNACVIQGYDYLVKVFKYCDKNNLPMAINVHYWHMRDYKDQYKPFFDFIHYALDSGAQPTTISELFKEYAQK